MALPLYAFCETRLCQFLRFIILFIFLSKKFWSINFNMNLFRIFLSATNFCFDLWEPCAVKESAVRCEHSWSPQISIRGQSHLLLQLLISQQHTYTHAEQTHMNACIYTMFGIFVISVLFINLSCKVNSKEYLATYIFFFLHLWK